MRLPVPPSPPRPPARAVAGFGIALVVVGLGWLWLRDSSLVAVRQVTVTGLSGPQAAQVRAALQDAARDMTTLHVRAGQLDTAVRPYATVASVEAHASFPHRLRIVVHEHIPVGAIASGSDRVPVAADGTLLRDTPSAGLPAIPGNGPPAGEKVGDARLEPSIALLAAAPGALRARATRVYRGPRGFTVPLRNGPVLYFGGGERLRAKWIAATRVLDDPSSAGATYVDVRLPERPAAGGLEAPAPIPPAGASPMGIQPQSTTPAP